MQVEPGGPGREAAHDVPPPLGPPSPVADAAYQAVADSRAAAANAAGPVRAAPAEAISSGRSRPKRARPEPEPDCRKRPWTAFALPPLAAGPAATADTPWAEGSRCGGPDGAGALRRASGVCEAELSVMEAAALRTLVLLRRR